MKANQLSSMVDNLVSTNNEADKYDTQIQQLEKPTKPLLETAITATNQVLSGAAKIKSLFDKDKADGIIAERKATLDQRLVDMARLSPSEQVIELEKINKLSDLSADLGFMPEADQNRVTAAFKNFFSAKVNSYQRNIVSGLIKKEREKNQIREYSIENEARLNPDSDLAIPVAGAIAQGSTDLSPDNLEDFKRGLNTAMLRGRLKGYTEIGNIVKAEELLNSKEAKELSPRFFASISKMIKHKKSTPEKLGAFESALTESRRAGNHLSLLTLNKYTGNLVFAKLATNMNAAIRSSGVPSSITVGQRNTILNAIPVDSKHGAAIKTMIASHIKKLNKDQAADPVGFALRVDPKIINMTPAELVNSFGVPMSTADALTWGNKFMAASRNPNKLSEMNMQFQSKFGSDLVAQAHHIVDSAMSQLMGQSDIKGQARLTANKAARAYPNDSLNFAEAQNYINEGVTEAIDKNYEGELSAKSNSIHNYSEVNKVIGIIATGRVNKKQFAKMTADELKAAKQKLFVEQHDLLTKHFLKNFQDIDWLNNEAGPFKSNLLFPSAFITPGSKEHISEFYGSINKEDLLKLSGAFDSQSIADLESQSKKPHLELNDAGTGFHVFAGPSRLNSKNGTPATILFQDVAKHGPKAFIMQAERNDPSKNLKHKLLYLRPNSNEHKIVKFIDDTGLNKTLTSVSDDVATTIGDSKLAPMIKSVLVGLANAETDYKHITKPNEFNAMGLFQVRGINAGKEDLKDIHGNTRAAGKLFGENFNRLKQMYANHPNKYDIRYKDILAHTLLAYNGSGFMQSETVDKFANKIPIDPKDGTTTIYVKSILGESNIPVSLIGKPARMSQKDYEKYNTKWTKKAKPLRAVREALGLSDYEFSKMLNKKVFSKSKSIKGI